MNSYKMATINITGPVNITGPIIILNYNRADEKKQEEKQICTHCCKNLPVSSFRMYRGRLNKTCSDCIDIGNPRCEHGKIKSICKEKDCGGSALCEHLIQKSKCGACGGASVCEHGRINRQCRECDGAGICEHGIRKEYCRECDGSRFCEHDRRKDHCILCCPLIALGQIVYKRINNAVGVAHATKWRELLGCPIEDFKEYIESKFEPWMTWNNYGNGYNMWNIDHSIPIDFENPTLEIKLSRFHYTNTKPMKASENFSKHNNYAE